jgi:hypothetical protein
MAVWAVSLLSTQLISHRLTPVVPHVVFGV